MTGKEILRHRDIYQKLYSTLIGYLNKGLGPEDTVQRNPLKEYEVRVRRSVRVPLRRQPRA